MSKITPVYGDITKPNLGLNEIHLAKVHESNLVFHVAASLRLEYSLKPNVLLNLVGTKNVIDISKNMKNLLLMVHFSTGFCCPDKEILNEEIVEWPHENPLDIIKMCELLDEDAMAKLQPHLLREHPNTYTYTKRLAEILCRDEYDKGFPICIVRPSIIIPAYQEPLVGWIDSLNGPAGLMIGAAKGVIRSMLADAETETEAIPVDIAVNGIILITKIVATEEKYFKELII
jgi:fatty acyl-CoA reductase